MGKKPPPERLRPKLQKMRETMQRLRKALPDKSSQTIVDVIDAELKKTLDRGRH